MTSPHLLPTTATGNGHLSINIPEPLSLYDIDSLLQKELPPPEPLVPGIFGEGVGELFGTTGIRKTWMLRQLALAKASGGVFLGRQLTPGIVLYFNLEESENLFQAHIKQQLCDTPGPGPGRLFYRQDAFPLNEEGMDRLYRTVRDYPIALIIFDPLEPFKPKRTSDDISAEDRRFTGEILRRFANITHTNILFSWNTSKGKKDDPAERASGPMGLVNGCDYALYLHGIRGEPGAVLQVIKDRSQDTPPQYELIFDYKTGLFDLNPESPLNGHPKDRHEARKCPGCKTAFIPRKSDQIWCSPECRLSNKYQKGGNDGNDGNGGRRWINKGFREGEPCSIPDGSSATLKKDQTEDTTCGSLSPARTVSNQLESISELADANASNASMTDGQHTEIGTPPTLPLSASNASQPQNAKPAPSDTENSTRLSSLLQDPPKPAQRPLAAPRLGILACEGLWSGDGPPQPAPAPATVGTALELAASNHLTDLWIHRSALSNDRLPEGWATATGWQEVRESGRGWRWTARSRPGGPLVSVAVPAWNTEGGSWDSWREVPTGRMLLAGLRHFHAATGLLPVGSPGTTAKELLRRCHKQRPLAAVSLPDVITKAQDATGRPMSWHRPLTTNERARRSLVSFDHRAHYLAACSSLLVGIGAPEHTEKPEFSARLPGYWRASVEAEIPPLLPPPFPLGSFRWYTTPALELLLQLPDAACEITEGYLFPDAGRVLTPWYEIVRDARRQLEELPEQDAAQEAALSAVKEMYAIFLGGRLKSEYWKGDAFYRPDWAALVVDQAQANLYRQLLRADAEGYHAALIHIDEVVFATDAEPADSMPPRWRSLDKLGAFDFKWSAPITPELIATWDNARNRAPIFRALEVSRDES